jgi:hypothetical protein
LVGKSAAAAAPAKPNNAIVAKANRLDMATPVSNNESLNERTCRARRQWRIADFS